ncbi:MAG: NAD-dependent epimerase/dehydratase family protein, partial [Polyangiaceae bacterium]|nr:NAD-dependent epimerase/dehydratase family protein [Polyangiaceae bacterium]
MSVPYSVEAPRETHDVSIRGTLNVLPAVKRRGVKQVVFACSAAIYGDDPEMPKRETMRPQPVGPYGIWSSPANITSRCGASCTARRGREPPLLQRLRRRAPRSGLAPTQAIISIFVDRALRGAGVTLFRDGGQTRDFVY